LKPICIDLYCGLGGWSEGFLSEGYECHGYDIEAHDYGTGGYPGTLHVRDIREIYGSEFKDVACIVGSSPCQKYSYMAMPWSRAKEQERYYMDAACPERITELNELFDAQFRIQREACEAAGRHIPMVVENVRGAQKFVGPAKYHYGSFYLWGDVPALMPVTIATKTNGHANIRDGHTHTRHLTNQRESDGVKQSGIGGMRENGKGDAWFQDGAARHGSKSTQRKIASAMIAKIPFALSTHIARCFKPQEQQ
jgi:hypothetical protein